MLRVCAHRLRSNGGPASSACLSVHPTTASAVAVGCPAHPWVATRPIRTAAATRRSAWNRGEPYGTARLMALTSLRPLASRSFSSRASAVGSLPAHQQRLSKIRNLGIIAHIDAGKCWGAGTLLMGYDGRNRRVEDIVQAVQAGESVLLMGDDGTPRTITPGSAVVGHTAADQAAFVEPHTGSAVHPGMYRITPQKGSGRDTWTCNGDHILVLQFNAPPLGVRRWPRTDLALPFYFSFLVLAEDGLVTESVHSFATETAAQKACDAALAGHQPLIWECTVNDFLRCSSHVQAAAQMFTPKGVTFQPPAESLQQRLRAALGLPANEDEDARLSAENIALTAWTLGMWLTAGDASDSRISMIGLDKSRSDHSRTDVRLALERWDSMMTQTFGRVSFDANQVRMGDMVLRKLLASYGLLGQKHFPSALLGESKAVRTALLAGVMDGDGGLSCAPKRSAAEVRAKTQREVDGLLHLARGLGLCTGDVTRQPCRDELGQSCHAYCVTISGDLPSIRTVLTSKRDAPSSTAAADDDEETHADAHCAGFTVSRIPHAAYYGFTLDGNGRCLLGDLVVTHNTTTAERLLFYARRTRVLGDVDRGDTVLDFMREERERGITIQAACITLQWSRVGPTADQVAHRLNLIDTPGHVDFTQQVEQSLRVLDSAICVLDGVKGVEAQTQCVWRQAAKYGVARLAFVNKMDRDGASMTRAVQSIQTKLHTTPLVITLPLFSTTAAQGGDGMRPAFVGVIDLVRMEVWEWANGPVAVSPTNLTGAPDDGSKFTVTPLTKLHRDYVEAVAARRHLLEQVSEVDDRCMELFLEAEERGPEGHLQIDSNEVRDALRRVACARFDSNDDSTPSSSSSPPDQAYTLVCCGSSKANKGVQYLLNAILDYLPSPLEKGGVRVEQVEKKANAPASAAPATAAALAAGKGGKAKKPSTTPSSAASKAAVPSSLGPTSTVRPIGGDPQKDPLLALVFKVTHDLQRGAMPIVFVRVYTGQLKKGDSIVALSPNSNPEAAAASLVKERPQKLLEISADELTIELPAIEAGNIGALVGLKGARTGDTLVSATALTGSHGSKGSSSLGYMRGISTSEPVFFCSVEAGSLSASRALDQALECLRREDPSLTVTTSADSGQTILAGMGELHLEIMRSRLQRDFGLGEEEGGAGVEFGAMRISYREGLAEEIRTTFQHSGGGGGGGAATPAGGASAGPASEAAETSMEVVLTPVDGAGVQLAVNLPSNMSSSASPNVSALIASIEAGLRDGLARGPLLGYPVTDVQVTVDHLTLSGPPTQAVQQSARACAARAVQAALRQAKSLGSAHLLEPIMSADVSVYSSQVGEVLSDLTAKRRASILDVAQQAWEGGDQANRSQIQAEVPLAAMLGYASILRSTTQGNGSFAMQFKEFRTVAPHVQMQLLESPP